MNSYEMLENIIKYYEDVTNRAMISLEREVKFQFRRNMTNFSLQQATKDYFQSIHNSENANKLIEEYQTAMKKMYLSAQKEYNMILKQIKSTKDEQLKQSLLYNYAENGIHGFTAKNGARWNIETYSHMYTRHVNNQLLRMNVLENSKKNRFLVSSHNTKCQLCQPWEGLVLTRDELEESTLFHPNCKHFITEV